MLSKTGSWPELVYRFIEHYKWEPQHFRGTTENFYSRVRAQEVPLNFLFNLLLRCSSAETIYALLRELKIELDGKNKGSLRLEYPLETGYTQPDVRIESEAHRIFIEIKVGAAIKIEQVQKYILLHAEMDKRFGVKQPYLLFLTEAPFDKCWKPREAQAVSDVGAFLRQRMSNIALPDRRAKSDRDGVFERYEAVKKEIEYGAATWDSIGRCLSGLGAQLKETGSREVEARIIEDFLRDLEQRGFLKVPASNLHALISTAKAFE